MNFSAHPWLGIGSSTILALTMVVQIYLVVRRQAVFGTESHRLRSLSGLPLSSPDELPRNFGTESVRVTDRADLKPETALPNGPGPKS